MTREKMRGNRELKKPKMFKATPAMTEEPFGKAVLERIALHKKKR